MKNILLPLIVLGSLVAFGCSNPASSGGGSSGSATVSLGTQSGTITSGSAGSATFAATTANVTAGTAGTVTWYTSSAGSTTTTVPTGITASVTNVASNASTVTMTAATTAVAGSYYFTVAFGSATSSIATLTVAAAVVTTYTVTYNGNGNTSGTAPVDSTLYKTGDTVTVLANSSSLSRTGSSTAGLVHPKVMKPSSTTYFFIGWSTSATGTVTYVPGQTFVMGSANVTLYAVWSTAPAAPSITSSETTITAYDTVTVTITCPTTGASIYYTTDGSIPTTSSTLYSTPFTFVANFDPSLTPEIISAIAVMSGTDSATTTVSYTWGW